MCRLQIQQYITKLLYSECKNNGWIMWYIIFLKNSYYNPMDSNSKYNFNEGVI